MTVTLLTSLTSAATSDADALVIGIIQTPEGPRIAAGAEGLDGPLDLAAQFRALGATGKPEETHRIATLGRAGAPLIVAVGIGSDEADTERLRRAAGAAVRELTGNHGSLWPGDPEQGAAGTRRIGLALPAGDPAQAEAVALGALLGAYTFGRYRVAHGPDFELILHTSQDQAAGRGRVLAEAMTLVRDLINTARADLVPADLADAAVRVAGDGGFGIAVLDEHELAKEGYGGILAVGMGSVHPPRLARLDYTHPGATRTVVLVGKGITFDSGGLSLKPSKSMETMKGDMGGAAAVLGAVQAIARLGLAVNVIGYLTIAENMPGGGAQRPSDVIAIYGGKTVEVLNTDAEGRLVMADAIVRSGADEPDLLVDVATLTGAQTVALGNRTAGVMASDNDLARVVADAAARAGESMWPMPLPDELRKNLDSGVADIANVSSDRAAGMLVAGIFLREFVPAGVRWAHLDIAGPAYNEGSAYGYTSKGGTGAAVRTLVQLAAEVADGSLAGE